jgi:hypothetical protein
MGADNQAESVPERERLSNVVFWTTTCIFGQPFMDCALGRCYSSPFLFAPLFFGLPFHGRCIRVLHFEPIGRAADKPEPRNAGLCTLTHTLETR